MPLSITMKSLVLCSRLSQSGQELEFSVWISRLFITFFIMIKIVSMFAMGTKFIFMLTFVFFLGNIFGDFSKYGMHIKCLQRNFETSNYYVCLYIIILSAAQEACHWVALLCQFDLS